MQQVDAGLAYMVCEGVTAGRLLLLICYACYFLPKGIVYGDAEGLGIDNIVLYGNISVV